MSQENDLLLRYALEIKQLNLIIYQHKKENLQLKKKIDEKDEKIKYLTSLVQSQKIQLELEQNTHTEQQEVIKKQEAVIIKLHRITKLFAELTENSEQQTSGREKILNESIIQHNFDHIQEKSFVKDQSNTKYNTQQNTQRTPQTKLPAIYDKNENLSVISIPIKNLKKLDEQEVAQKILKQPQK